MEDRSQEVRQGGGGGGGREETEVKEREWQVWKRVLVELERGRGRRRERWRCPEHPVLCLDSTSGTVYSVCLSVCVLSTLSVHAQRGLWYLPCLSVCLSVCCHSSGGMAFYAQTKVWLATMWNVWSLLTSNWNCDCSKLYFYEGCAFNSICTLWMSGWQYL